MSVTENVQAYKVEGHRHAAELEQELNGARFTFVPHLMPVDQGLLASCYVTRGPRRGRDALDLYREAYEDEPFVELVGRAARHARRARDEPLPHPRERGGRARDRPVARSTTSGRAPAGQAVQDLNLMLGLPETEGLE